MKHGDMRKRTAMLAIVALGLLNIVQLLYPNFDFVKYPVNLIHDEASAVAVARALLPAHGVLISEQEPFSVRNDELRGHWVVSAHVGEGSDVTGDTVAVTIRKNDGKILSIRLHSG